jgi:hypothetical protein
MSKYHSKKVTYNGEVYDSIKEWKRHEGLKLLEKAGAIEDLQRQVKFVLIPAQYEPKWFPRLNKMGNGKCIERECAYIADFVYKKDGETVVEDTKGFKTKDYIIKRKLMLKEHGIRIKEI